MYVNHYIVIRSVNMTLLAAKYRNYQPIGVGINFGKHFVELTYEYTEDAYRKAVRSLSGGYAQLCVSHLEYWMTYSVNVARGLLAAFRGSPLNKNPHQYGEYIHNASIDTDLFDREKVIDPTRSETRFWINRYIELLLCIKVFLESLDVDKIDGFYLVLLPQGRDQQDPIRYIHRTVDEFLQLKLDHERYLSRNTFALAKGRMELIWRSRSIDHGSPINIDEVPRIDMACLLRSNVLRRSFEFVVPT
jgi:hypothetical protein